VAVGAQGAWTVVPLKGHLDKAVGFQVANLSLDAAWTVRVCDEVG